jgi:tetrahydromethanopterin S-methyltransferase subunit H
VHCLAWLEKQNKKDTLATIDSLISVEIPDINTDPLGYALVSEFMMHGPLGYALRCISVVTMVVTLLKMATD